MRTKRRILEIMLAVMAATGAGVATLIVLFGLAGAAAAAVVAVLAWMAYRIVLRPWHSGWGATEAERAATMDGDELVIGAARTTRAIGIDCPASQVWPWLVQLGYGRAGWYSYDWIDNDGLPSATRIIPEFQLLHVGDRIEMMPESGFVVRAIKAGETIVSQSDDGSTTWCLRLVSTGDGRCRLLSRFSARFKLTLASVLWVALADPGTFIMERRMLKGIKQRAEKSEVAQSHRMLRPDGHSYTADDPHSRRASVR